MDEGAHAIAFAAGFFDDAPDLRAVGVGDFRAGGVARQVGDEGPGETGVVGSYWTRTNNPEIDVVIADTSPVAASIYAVGSIKWRSGSPFDNRDLSDLITHRGQLPGASVDTPLIVVPRSGCTVPAGPRLRIIEPDELVAAWA